MLVKRFEEQVSKNPDKLAIQTVEEAITYKKLDKMANGVADLLENNQKQDIIGLLFDRAVLMIAGMLGTLKVGSAYIPLPVDYPETRLRYMIAHSGLSLILTDCDKTEFAEKLAAGTDAEVCVVSGLDSAGVEYKQTDFENNRLMYILYTSGSTGTPKGVMQTCENVLHFIDRYTETLSITGEDRLTLLSSFSHDAAVMDIYAALLNGITLFPLDIKEQADFSWISRWLVREGITVWHSVPTVYRYFVNALGDQDSFPGLRLIVLGGEAVRPQDIDMFKHRFPHAALYNLYGQTESSYNSGKLFTKETASDTITIGEPVRGTDIFLIDKNGTRVKALETGEIVVASPHVSPGYWKDKEATGMSFRNHPKFGPLYRTGDMGRLLLDGSIEFAGRKDNQVKIRGFRVEPAEIENRLLTHEKVKEAVVIARQSTGPGDTETNNKGDAYLCAYIVGKGVEETELKTYLAGLLPGYMTPAFFVVLDRLPLTESGKLDRRALPEPEPAAKNQYTAPRNALEEQLVEIWSEILPGLKTSIGIDDNFFSLGGHSLKAITLVSAINERLKVKISLMQLLRSPTIRGVAEYIQMGAKKEVEFAAVTPDKENLHRPFPITDIQMTYLLGRSSRFEIGGVSTHGYREFAAKVDIQQLNRSLNKVIRRHPMLRTVILDDGSQMILEGEQDLEYKIPVEDLEHLDPLEQDKQIEEERERMSHYVFDPAKWPLFEIKAFKLSGDIYCLCIGEDRIIMDNFSSRIIHSEILGYYFDPRLELPELQFSFRDYMLAYKALEDSPVYAAARDYWLNRLDDFPFAPELPLAGNPADIQNPRFKRFTREFTTAQWERLKAFAGKNNITPSVLLCTVFAEVLSYWSNQSRFALNLTLFNRYPFHKDVNKLVGDFTSLLLLAVDFRDRHSFSDKARNLQNTLFEAIEHRFYDGVRFIRELGRHHNMRNKAVMPIVFTSVLVDSDNRDRDPELAARAKEIVDTGNRRESYFSSQTSQAFIDNIVSDAAGDLTVSWNFVEDLFHSEVIETMFRQYITRLINLSEDNFDNVFQLTDTDRRLLEEYNKTEAEIPACTLHRLFCEQVEAGPDRAALVHGEQTITYRELDKQCNRLARYLRNRGIGKGSFVGVLAERGIPTIVHLMGILAAGAAYVPVDPEYPRERIDYILKQAKCELLLEPGFLATRVDPGIDRSAVERIENTDSPEDIAYVIFTSGSTGQPKGVVITHGAVTNTLIDINRRFSVTPGDRVMAISSLCFDLSVYDVFGTLGAGAVCVIIDDQRDIEHLTDTLERDHITVWNSVPSIMDLVVNRRGNSAVFQLESGSGEDEEELFFWSPVEQWQMNGSAVRIGANLYKGCAGEVVPRLHELTRDGMSLKNLEDIFPGVNLKQLNDLIEDLIGNRVLVNSILSPREIFNPHNALFSNQKFNQKFCGGPGGDFSKEPHGRRRQNQISFKTFSDLLAIFKQRKEGGDIRYYYASAGGLYPIDIYIYIKQGSVERMEEGLYYYSPGEHVLHRVTDGPVFLETAYAPSNRPVFESSAFSVYMIYNAEVTMPKYGGLGYFMAGIDAGILAGTMAQWSQSLGIDVCVSGRIEFEAIREHFKLRKNQVFILSTEVGSDLNTGTGTDASIDTSAAVVHNVQGNGGPAPMELFEAQNKLFKNRYSKAILVIPDAYEAFKKQQLSRVYDIVTHEKTELENSAELPSFIRERRSYRTFDETGTISSDILFQLLSVFSSRKVGTLGIPDYYHESAGGFYSIDVFLYVKQGRVKELDRGLYYYNPGSASLELVDNAVIPETSHFTGNRSIYKSSALSLFMIYNGGAVDSKNPALGFFKSAVHCGRAVAELTKISESSGIGLCSIGNMDFSQIRHYFNLNPNQVFLHGIELGLKPAVSDMTKTESSPYILSLESNPDFHENNRKNRSLRLVLLSGDWLPLPLPQKIREQFEKAEVFSLGGATEGSIWSIYYPVKEVKKEWKSIPYGFPLANQQFYVLNRHMELCPVGVQGELYIGGVGVALGYMGDEEKTNAAFIHHPGLGHIYKTGDYGVFRREGYIEFLGRKDTQVKIRGYRVELGEIEAVLLQHPAVTNAIVIVYTDPAKKKDLCAYVVTCEELPVAELRTYLAGKLPGYMIPTYFIYMDEIPLTQNRKVDRKALPEPDVNAHKGVEYVEPGTDIEKTIAAVCKDMFNLDKISIHENFFDLGASSINILELSKRLKGIYNINIPILKMFEYSTIRSFALYLDRQIKGKNSDSKVKEEKRKEREKEEVKRTDAVNKAKDRFRQRIRNRTPQN
jgi:amino acid adenylation domain-containing protein